MTWSDPRGQQPPYEPPPGGQYPAGQYGPQYPAGQYGPQYPGGQYPPGQYGQQPPNPFGPEGNEAFGIVGAVLALLGGVVLIVAFTALEWFTGDRSFSDVGNILSNEPNPGGFAAAYFHWLAWTFLIVTVVAAVLSSFPSPAVRALRIVGVVVGVAAAGLSFLALQLDDASSYLDFLKNARAGFYLAVVGYLLAAIGAGIGPRRV